MARYDNVSGYRDQIVQDIQELVRIRSVLGTPTEGAPFGAGPAAALEYALSRARSLGFTTEQVGGYAGHAQYGTTGPTIGILVHLDVVPEGEGWTHDPFGGEIDGDYLYGRGASDNKGPAIAALYSLRAFADQVPNPPCRVRVIFGTNEESGMEGVARYFERFPLPDLGFSPDAAYPLFNREKGIFDAHLNAQISAPTDGDPAVAISAGTALNVVPERAVAVLRSQAEVLNTWKRLLEATDFGPYLSFRSGDGELTVEARGKAAHGGNPAAGENAIARLVDALVAAHTAFNARDARDASRQPTEATDPWARLRAANSLLGTSFDGSGMEIASTDQESGDLTVNWATLTVTDREFTTGLNIRYPVTAEFGPIRSGIEDAAQARGMQPRFGKHLAPLFLPADAPIVTRLLHAYRTVTGEEAQPQSMAGGTYARMLGNRGVAFGAGFAGLDTRAHQADEFISIPDLMRHAEIQTEAIFQLAGL